MKKGFEKIDDNSNMYLKTEKGKGILLAIIFVNDIVFGDQDNLCKTLSKEMMDEFEMSMFGEIKIFVGLKINQMNHDIFITQSKYLKEFMKTFGKEDFKPISTPMVTGHKLSENDVFIEVN